jgi:hypothetical protein
LVDDKEFTHNCDTGIFSALIQCWNIAEGSLISDYDVYTSKHVGAVGYHKLSEKCIDWVIMYIGRPIFVH